jgi:hypothetical protein
VLLKFAGLGGFGKEIHARARELSDAGYAPPVLGLINGFLMMRFLPGKPLSEVDINEEFINRVADYLAFRERRFPAHQGASLSELMQMIRVNTMEGLGEDWMEKVLDVLKLQSVPGSQRPVAIDGRMMLHEWLRVGETYVKTDGTDHHSDHFMPGCQDIAWDIAGCCIESNLAVGARERLIDTYGQLSGDGGLRERLTFYMIAYLAYRLGYASMAADTLHYSEDGPRFRRLAYRYGVLLKSLISQGYTNIQIETKEWIPAGSVRE